MEEKQSYKQSYRLTLTESPARLGETLLFVFVCFFNQKKENKVLTMQRPKGSQYTLNL